MITSNLEFAEIKRWKNNLIDKVECVYFVTQISTKIISTVE